MILTVRQALELARVCDRHGAATLRELGDGTLVVALDSRGKRQATVALALGIDGQIRASRSIAAADREDEEDGRTVDPFAPHVPARILDFDIATEEP